MAYPEASPSLVLFDIDGTLIRRAGVHHREALEYATWRVFRVRTSLDGIATQGQLDTGLLVTMLARAGVPGGETRAAMPELIRITEARYESHGPESLRHCVCPGVSRLLRGLTRRGIPLLVVTGNFPAVGWKKLALAGLREHFLDGAFAGMRNTRAGLVRLAVHTARKRGWVAADASVALVGDSPNDIHAAHANGVRSVAVATGLNSLDDLRGYGPRVLVASLHRLRLEALLGAESEDTA